MYERNAIVIERFFSRKFGYEENSNLKNNYNNYKDLIAKLIKYQEISDKENYMMLEFEKTANEIKDIQKIQESFYRRSLKLQETRKSLFESLDEDVEILQKKFVKVEEEIEKNNEEMKENSQKFITEIEKFNEKSQNRNQCGKERRIVENEYQKALEQTTNDFGNIDVNFVNESKKFVKQESKEEEKDQIKVEILSNGAKEKVPFDQNVILNAIDVATDLEEKKLEILVTTYERTARILNEIRNDSVRIERHQKVAKDAESKLIFLNLVSEYIVLFLDNERMNAVGGEKEHKKIMDEACKNLKKDLEQIKNLYELLTKEIIGKATKKLLKELYNPDYMQDLLNEEKEFEESISNLNVVGTIIYPNYWRVEGMQKIFDTFKKIMVEVYDKDFSEYEPIKIIEETVNLSEVEDDDIFDEEEFKKNSVANEDDDEDDDLERDLDWEDEEFDNIDIEETEEDDEEDIEEDENKVEDVENDEYEIKDMNDDDLEEEDTLEDEQKKIKEERSKKSKNLKKYELDEEEKEIDEILGFYDEEDDVFDTDDDDTYDDINFEWEEDEKEKKPSKFLDDDKIFDDVEEKELEEPKKRRGFFGRRRK